MEQNKVLMIIVSVAIFFVAIVGVGVALLYPRDGGATTAVESSADRGFDPIEYVRKPDTAPLKDEVEDEEPVIIVYGERDDESAVVSERNSSGRRTITVAPVPSPGKEAEATTGQTTPEPAPTPAPAPAPAPAGAVSSPAPATPSTSSPATSGRPAKAPSVTEKRPEPRRIRVTEYWIQLIASPSRDRVEYVEGLLADYSLGGRVTTRDVNGELYYRLRVGPYKDQQEAEKFLTWIRDIDGFEEAYISEEYPLRTVNG